MEADPDPSAARSSLRRTISHALSSTQRSTRPISRRTSLIVQRRTTPRCVALLITLRAPRAGRQAPDVPPTADLLRPSLPFQPVDPPLAALDSAETPRIPALTLTTEAASGDKAEGEHLEPRDVTPSRPLPSTILSPVASPQPQPDLTAELSPDSPDYALVTALKAQLRAVEEQRDQINTKLVRSLERCADLEDEVFHAQDGDRQKAAKIITLEEERKEHLHALECVNSHSSRQGCVNN